MNPRNFYVKPLYAYKYHNSAEMQQEDGFHSALFVLMSRVKKKIFGWPILRLISSLREEIRLCIFYLI
jgi:hypothetical protein